MSFKSMHRLISIIYVAFCVIGVQGATQVPLSLAGGDAVSVGIYIAPVEPGSSPVVDCESSRLLAPASILKSLTSATALSILGPDYRWSTDVLAVGQIENGVLEGDIVIRGTGDPTVDSRFFRENYGFCEKIVASVRRAGISAITGCVRVDGSRFVGAGVNSSWEVEDIGWDYGAGIYSLNYMDNAFAVKVPGYGTAPYVPDLTVEPSLTDGSTPLYVSRGAGSEMLRIGGSLGKRKSATLWCSMPSPRKVVEFKADSMIVAGGIRVGHRDMADAALADTMKLATHYSPRLSVVLRSLMSRSDNMMAEGALRAIAPMATRNDAIKAECEYWSANGVDLTYCRIVDGSGLARSNALSAAQLGKVLQKMAVGRYGREFVDLFPRAGLDGTLKTFMSSHRRKNEFMLKTGSMSGVQCYAGYHVDPGSGKPTHVIVVMINNMFGPRQAVRKAVENFLLNMKF